MTVNISELMKSIRNIMREDTGINGDAQCIEQLGWMIFLKVFSDKESEMKLMIENYISLLTEQDVIVEKVEKLYAYCDEREKQILKSQCKSNLLMQSVLKETFIGVFK